MAPTEAAISLAAPVESPPEIDLDALSSEQIDQLLGNKDSLVEATSHV
jgi:hypothetical protein